ncbi:Transposase-associated domain [Fagus crenata]
MAHHYILTYCEEIGPWIANLYNSRDKQVNDQILSLARGPDPRARVYTRYCINGFLFRTKEAEKTLKTQNSSVVVKGDERTGYIDWFGVIKKIIALDYLGSKQIVLFKCDWFEVPSQGRNQSSGYRKDKYGFISVDVTRLYYKDDPFILGIQAEQVYYARDVKNPNWCAVIGVKPRNLFAMPNKEQEVDDENNVFDNETYHLNEIPISQHDVGDRHLEDDYISNNNDTDLEEDLEEDEFFEHCLDDITDDDN